MKPIFFFYDAPADKATAEKVCHHCFDSNRALTTAFCSTRAFTCSNFPDTTLGKMEESAPLQNSRYSPGIHKKGDSKMDDK